MTIMVDPQDMIISMSPGHAVYGRTYRPGPFMDFYVREKSETIKSLRKPVITIRPGVFYHADMALVVVMFLIGKDYDQLFEQRFNYHATAGDGKKAMEDLSVQDNIGFHFYGDSRRKEKSIAINNNLKEFFRRACEGAFKFSPWSMADFDRAREELYREYPTPVSLWDKLGQAVQ